MPRLIGLFCTYQTVVKLLYNGQSVVTHYGRYLVDQSRDTAVTVDMYCEKNCSSIATFRFNCFSNNTMTNTIETCSSSVDTTVVVLVWSKARAAFLSV